MLWLSLNSIAICNIPSLQLLKMFPRNRQIHHRCSRFYINLCPTKINIPIVGSAITIMICVVGVNRSINALKAPVRNSNDRNSEFSFLYQLWKVIWRAHSSIWSFWLWRRLFRNVVGRGLGLVMDGIYVIRPRMSSVQTEQLLQLITVPRKIANVIRWHPYSVWATVQSKTMPTISPL